MTTIINLSQEWWNTLDVETQMTHSYNYYDMKVYDSLTDSEIENIFYQEVIVKWWDNLPTWGNPSKEYYMGLYFVDDNIAPERIKEVYLKEHQLPISEFSQLNYECNCITCKNIFYSNKKECRCASCAINSLNEQPKEEVDVWDEFAMEYSQLHSLDLEQVRYWFIPLIKFGKKNYTLIKKQ